MSLARRIIPCLDVRDGQVVKGVRFRDHQVVGDIVELAARYRDAGADELVFYDITASPQQRSVDVSWVERVSAVLDIPFCVAGGIRSLATADTILRAGADKISINSPALQNPDLINQLADEFGRQCVVIGIDSILVDDHWQLRHNTGDPEHMIDSQRLTLDWLVEVQQRGAGEIVLNCMDADGVRSGYDLVQLAAARKLCQVPLIASGGAGAREHFDQVFCQADVDGALAASVFHKAVLAIPELKQWLHQQGHSVRTLTPTTDSH